MEDKFCESKIKNKSEPNYRSQNLSRIVGELVVGNDEKGSLYQS